MTLLEALDEARRRPGHDVLAVWVRDRLPSLKALVNNWDWQAIARDVAAGESLDEWCVRDILTVLVALERGDG